MTPAPEMPPTSTDASPAAGPDFSRPVGPDGYAWWYLDAISDDGVNGLTLIAFIGSVFSPYYAFRRRRGPVAAEDHCAMNVALYGRPGRWAMTERGAGTLRRDRESLVIGPSRLEWDGQRLHAEIAEIGMPLPRRLKGRIVVTPRLLNTRSWSLTDHGEHRWQPIAPVADVTVEFERPQLRWQGHGYFDTNHGDRPLETSFVDWDWSRTVGAADSTVLYQTAGREDAGRCHALTFHADGRVATEEPPPEAALPPTPVWRMHRRTRSDSARADVVQTFEDTPFYARSLIGVERAGVRVKAVHESLSLDRFRHPVVQCMLPFRMPRRAR